jgi:hypothetical protein
MPHNFNFDSTNRIRLWRFEGRITDEELKEFYLEAPNYVPSTALAAAIVDFSSVTSFEVSPGTIRGLARSAPIIADASFPRFLVAPTSAIFGLMRMFQLAGEKTHPNVYVVKSLNDVFVSLGVEKPQFEPMPKHSESRRYDAHGTR